MTLADELESAASAAAAYGEVSAVLAAEPAPGRRAYLVALGGDEARAWLVLDAELRPVEERERVRETASIVVLSRARRRARGRRAARGASGAARHGQAHRAAAGDRGGRGGRARARAHDRGAADRRLARSTSTRSARRRPRSSGRSATTPRRSRTRLRPRPEPSRRSSPRSRDGTCCRCARVLRMEGGEQLRLPVRRRSRGSPARAARVRRAAGRVGSGDPARAVRDADAEHRGRAHLGGALADLRSAGPPTSRRSRYATRCACSSPRRSRS